MGSNFTIRQSNNFNLIRFVLAALVLLSHASELIYGNRSHEVLTRVFGTISFGELAVDGFFLLSGYLIVQSWIRSPKILDFFKKRVFRIYPGFIIACFISAFLVGPLGSSALDYFSQFNTFKFLIKTFLLQLPDIPPVFAGTPYPRVNDSLWTIPYEFRCYMLVALFGGFGFFRKRHFWLILIAIALFLFLIPTNLSRINILKFQYLLGDPIDLCRFLTFFGVGGAFYLFQSHIPLKTNWALVSALLLTFCMFRINLVKLALPIFGGYLLFWFAFVQIPFLKSLNSIPDISYGVYLYGWPVQKLLIWYFPSFSPWILFLTSLMLACICGLMSWTFVERPCLELIGRRESRVVRNNYYETNNNQSSK